MLNVYEKDCGYRATPLKTPHRQRAVNQEQTVAKAVRRNDDCFIVPQIRSASSGPSDISGGAALDDANLLHG